MKNYTLILTFIFAFQLAKTQNYCKNWSFEDTIKCPDDVSQLERAKYWINPSGGTPDYFNECDSIPLYPTVPPNVGVPYNSLGWQQTKTGNAYAGFILFAGNRPEYPNTREYISTKLVKPLELGIKYYVSFYVSLADSYNYATDGIGAYLSIEKIMRDTIYYGDTLSYTPQIANPQGNIIKDKKNWTLISSEIIGNGERYITIGNFKSNNNMDTLHLTDGSENERRYLMRSYYYADDICISEDSSNCNFVVSNELIQTQIKNQIIYNSFSQKLFVNNLNANKISIYNSLGILVKNITLTNEQNEIDVSHLEKGIYFAQIISTTGSFYYKFIIF